MSDPIEKLEKSCEIVGGECLDLVKKRKEKRIGDFEFINQYFQLLSSIPDKTKRDNIVIELENYIKKYHRLGKTTWLKK